MLMSFKHLLRPKKGILAKGGKESYQKTLKTLPLFRKLKLKVYSSAKVIAKRL
jgi:hypothetical protein